MLDLGQRPSKRPNYRLMFRELPQKLLARSYVLIRHPRRRMASHSASEMSWCSGVGKTSMNTNSV